MNRAFRATVSAYEIARSGSSPTYTVCGVRNAPTDTPTGSYTITFPGYEGLVLFAGGRWVQRSTGSAEG
jgi:hypothetical protein